MAMKRNPDCMRSHIRARAWIAALLSILAAMLALIVSCRSSQTQQAGRGLSEEQELRHKFAELSRREQVLTAELALARNQAPYLALDVVNRKLDLKVQGHSLRSFNIVKIQRKGGSPFLAQNWLEIEAKPLQITTRPRLVPGSGEATTASVATRDPWGPKRMPADYDLICKGAQALEIRSLASEQSYNRFTRWIISSYRQFRDWTREVFSRNKSVYKESIEIWLGEDDAQLLFWSLPKQFGILVLNAN